jgi:hypothetical protein
MKRMIIVGWALLGSLGCEASKLQLCDITAADCQESIYLGNVRVRGDGYDPFQGVPPIRTIGEEQFRAEMKAEAEQAAQNPAAQQPWWDSALALLHLMPSATEVEQDAIDNRVEQVAAYYDPSTRKVTVIDHQQPQTDSTRLGNMITLAHELLHAIQDRELDLDINPKTTDELFANKALIEGDATTYELLFALELEPRIKQVYPDPLSYANKLRSMFMADGPKLADDSDETNFASLGPPYMAAMYLVYPLGGIWVGEHYKQGGNSAVRHAYGKAPMRSLEYLLPMGTTVPSVATTPCAPSFPSSQGFAARGKDTLGAVLLYGYLMGWGVKSDAAVAAASLWRGDAIYAAYNANTQKTAVAWRIELAQPISAATVAQITTSDGPRVVQEGNILLMTASDDAQVAADWKPSTSCP